MKKLKKKSLKKRVFQKIWKTLGIIKIIICLLFFVLSLEYPVLISIYNCINYIFDILTIFIFIKKSQKN